MVSYSRVVNGADFIIVARNSATAAGWLLTSGGRAAVFVLVAALCLSQVDAASHSRTSGVVLDSRTQQPIAAAQVTAECRQEESHGSRVIDNLVTQTDINGVYSFKLSSLAPCDFMFVRATKEGYQMASSFDLRLGYSHFQEIPDRLYLTPESDVRLQLLEYELSMSTGTNFRDASGKPLPEAEYQHVLAAFHCSRMVAKEDREVAFIREHYCDRLRVLEENMINAQHQLPSSFIGCAPGHAAPTFKVDPNEARKFCEVH